MRCLIALWIGVYSACPAFAQGGGAPVGPLDFAVSPTPVGSGARAAGMADAFVAVADDATAASWNPAGLIQLEAPEIAIIGSYNTIRQNSSLPGHPEFERWNEDSSIDLNFLSVVYPVFAFERKIALSLSYQRKYDFSRSLRGSIIDSSPIDDDVFTMSTQSSVLNQTGGLSTITPSIAVQLSTRLSVGASFHFWRTTPLSKNEWNKDISNDIIQFTTNLPDDLKVDFERDQSERYRDIEGESVSLGILWTPTSRLNVGMRYDSKFSGKADYSFNRVIRKFGTVTEDVSGSERRKLTIPATLSLGVSYRFNDRLTLTFDLSRTDWEDFNVTTGDGTKISLVTGLDPDTSPVGATITARLGAEYVFLPERLGETLDTLWTLRGGIFFDQEPATGFTRSDTKGDAKADDFYGFALGVGVQLYNRVNIDVAYQLRYGDDVNSDNIRTLPGFSEDFIQHRVLLATVIYF